MGIGVWLHEYASYRRETNRNPLKVKTTLIHLSSCMEVFLGSMEIFFESFANLMEIHDSWILANKKFTVLHICLFILYNFSLTKCYRSLLYDNWLNSVCYRILKELLYIIPVIKLISSSYPRSFESLRWVENHEVF
jgi:hypothetical protein